MSRRDGAARDRRALVGRGAGERGAERPDLDVDVVALVSVDQLQSSDPGRLSFLYLSVIGAYTLPLDRNDTRTLIDAAVFHVPSRALLLRAPAPPHRPREPPAPASRPAPGTSPMPAPTPPGSAGRAGPDGPPPPDPTRRSRWRSGPVRTALPGSPSKGHRRAAEPSDRPRAPVPGRRPAAARPCRW